MLSNADKCVSIIRSACDLNFALANTTSKTFVISTSVTQAYWKELKAILPTLAEPYDKFSGQPLEVTLWIKPHIEPPAKERSGWQQHPSKWNRPKTKSHFLHHSRAQLPLPQVSPRGHLQFKECVKLGTASYSLNIYRHELIELEMFHYFKLQFQDITFWCWEGKEQKQLLWLSLDDSL